jgi:hypothetical protein
LANSCGLCRAVAAATIVSAATEDEKRILVEDYKRVQPPGRHCDKEGETEEGEGNEESGVDIYLVCTYVCMATIRIH